MRGTYRVAQDAEQVNACPAPACCRSIVGSGASVTLRLPTL